MRKQTFSSQVIFCSVLFSLVGCAQQFDFAQTELEDTSEDTLDEEPEVGAQEEVGCENRCEEGETRCAENSQIEVCEEQADHCLDWGQAQSCGMGSCENNVCDCYDDRLPVENECAFIPPGSDCLCDDMCEGTELNPGVCVAGICMQLASEECNQGTTDGCALGFRCWMIDFNPMIASICFPDCDAFDCNACDTGGSCISENALLCDESCSDYCLSCGENSHISNNQCVCDDGFRYNNEECVCNNTCETGDQRCGNSSTLETCFTPNGEFCPIWDPVQCPEEQTCSSGECGCFRSCEEGERRCIDENTYQVCERAEGMLCPVWNEVFECSTTRSDKICIASGECICTPNHSYLCRETRSQLWSLDGCGFFEESVENCELGCTSDGTECLGEPEMIQISAGEYTLGSPENEVGRDDDEYIHNVRITYDYLISATEVTQELWIALMGENPSYFIDCGGDCPVESVTWLESLRFANELSIAFGLDLCYEIDGNQVISNATNCSGYRLPTDAEWEIAARAKTTTAVFTGDLTSATGSDPVLNEIAFYAATSANSPRPVGSLLENEWGMHDSAGNVWEWTWNWYENADPQGNLTDPFGPLTGSIHTRRGGSWQNEPDAQRAANREPTISDYRSYNTGFRLVQTLLGEDGI